MKVMQKKLKQYNMLALMEGDLQFESVHLYQFEGHRCMIKIQLMLPELFLKAR